MGLDPGQAIVDFGDSCRVLGSFRLGKQGGALAVCRQNRIQQALGPVWRLLGDAPDARSSGQTDGAGIGFHLAHDKPEQGRLAGAVAAHQTHFVAARHGYRGAVEQRPSADAVYKSVDP